MSWQDRLLSTIHMESPSGRVFRPLWRGNSRTKDKKLGVFEIPQVRGAVVQDLDVSADRYPLTFYFDGPDHDLEADLFWQTCNERGVWSVTHPVYGTLDLQLVGITQQIEPVDSGNVTVFESEWLEPGVNLPETAITQWAEDVRAQAEEVITAASNQAERTITRFSPGMMKLINAIVAVVRIYNKIKALAALAMFIKKLANQAIAYVGGAVVRLVAGVKALVALPGAIIKDIKARVSYYKDLIVGVSSTPVDRSDVGALAVNELVMSVAIAEMAKSLTEVEITSREEALAYIADINDVFLRMTYALDAYQSDTYISQSESYNDTVRMVALTTGMLLRRSFDLAVARRFTLSVPRTPIDIALTEGVDFDAFLTYNHLKGNDILILPAGRSVVVYQ